MISETGPGVGILRRLSGRRRAALLIGLVCQVMAGGIAGAQDSRPIAYYTESPLEFGAREIGTTSDPLRVNNTDYDVIVQDQGSFEGTHPADFHTPDGQGPYIGLGFINPGGRYSVALVFQPSASGPRSVSAHFRLTIRRQLNHYGATSNTAQELMVSLRGTGIVTPPRTPGSLTASSG